MLALVLTLCAIWSKPAASHCTVSASPKGDRALLSCRSDDALTLSLVTADGRSVPVKDVDNVLSDAVPTGPPQWSPSGRFVAFEIGLDEEPGVLLIEAGNKPSAVFVDKPLVPMQIAGAGPQWHPSGEWLLFHSSGTGGALKDEGVFALRMKDRNLFRLLSANVRSMTVSANTLYVVRVDALGSGKADVAAFALDELLRKAVRIAPAAR